MRKVLFAYWLLTCLMLKTSLGLGTLMPFNASASRSEQLGYSGASTQIISMASADSLTLSLQLYDNAKPSSTKIMHFTRSRDGFSKAWERELPLPRLVGMTCDNTNFYVVCAAHEDLSSDIAQQSFRSNILIITKFDNQGKQIWQRDLNNPEYLGNSNEQAIFSPLTAGTGAVSYGAGKIIVALASNTLPDRSFRHQRAQYFVVGADGAGFRAASETSWRHSFDQRLIFDGQDFIFMDLADAGWYMPGGGITLRKIRPTASGAEFIGDQDNKQGTYIYARQAETDNYQNFTFISLGDIEEGSRGYAVVFTSEKSNLSLIRNGFSQPVLEPRNLAFVHVTQGFENVREGSWDSMQTRGNTIIRNSSPVNINITRNVVDSQGPSYTFARPQDPSKTFTQTGVVWLTNLQPGLSAERPKMIKLNQEQFIILWEQWSYNNADLSHKSTHAMLINEQGQTLAGPVLINARLNPSGADKLFIIDNKAGWITSDMNGKFFINTIDAHLNFSTRALDSAHTHRDAMSAHDTLRAGEMLQSKNGLYKLIYQNDGNLVLYTSTGSYLWASHTAGNPAGYATMQSDGNFAIYTPEGRFLWNTATLVAGSSIIMQNDGNLVVYTPAGRALWASNTAQF